MNNIKAAAVLAFRGSRVLAFVREQDGHLGLPCGKVNRGESPREAALRELAEETGYRCDLLDSEPFVAFDPRGACVVATYLADDDLVEGTPTHEHEGSPVWASVRDLLKSGYGDYNRRLLRHFGIQQPVGGKLHSHLTLSCSLDEAERARKLVGGKVTIIDLSRVDSSKNQTDVMLTHHFLVGKHGLEDHLDVLASLRAKAQTLRDTGILVSRAKLEHELLHPHSDPSEVSASLQQASYVEAHVKCKVDHKNLDALKRAASSFGWHPSRNPLHQQNDGVTTQFVNKRFYNETDLNPLEAQVDGLVSLLSGMPFQVDVCEAKIETALYDSNDQVDAWWMDKAEET